MSKKSTDINQPPPDDGLRGGTQGGGIAPQQGHPPGGTNALTPSGGSHPGHAPEPPTGDKSAADREDPQRALAGNRTKQSPDVIAQRARDAANVEGSSTGVDEGNPRQIPEDAPAADGRTGND